MVQGGMEAGVKSSVECPSWAVVLIRMGAKGGAAAGGVVAGGADGGGGNDPPPTWADLSNKDQIILDVARERADL